MGLNGIGGSAASWAQFVKVSHAARERNSGFSASGANNAAQNENINTLSFKRAVDVYSGRASAPNVSAAQPKAAGGMNSKTVGVQFDAYA
jgi:hypothetical protein